MSRGRVRTRIVFAISPILAALAGLAVAGADAERGERPPEWPDPASRARAESAPMSKDAGDPGKPLLQPVFDRRFEAPLLLRDGHASATNGTHTFLISDGERLVVLDHATGEPVREIVYDVPSGDPFHRPDQVEWLPGGGAGAALLAVLADNRPGEVRVYDVGDPATPVEIGAFETDRDQILLPLPQPGLAVLYASSRSPQIWDMRTQTLVGEIAHASPRRLAVSEDPARPRLAFIHEGSAGTELVVFDLSDPAAPVFLSYVQGADPRGQLALSPSGRLVLHTEFQDVAPWAPRTAYLRDAGTGELLWTLDLARDRGRFSFLDGPGGTVLAHAREEGVDLYRLQDPRSPELYATLPIEAGRGWASKASTRWLVIDESTQELVLVDTEDGEELSRFRHGTHVPRAMRARDAEGEIEVSLLSHVRRLDDDLPAGRLVVFQALRVRDDARFEPQGAFEDVLPDAFRALSTLAGRYLVGYSPGSANALLVVDTADGSVIDARHPRFPGSWRGTGLIDLEAAGDHFVLAVESRANGVASCYELFALREDAVEVVDHACQRYDGAGRIQDLELREDGLLLATTGDHLLVRTPRGGEGSLELDPWHGVLELSPDGERLLLTRTWFGSWVPLSFGMASLEDPLEPELLYESDVRYTSTSRFVRDGEAVISPEGFSTYAPRLHDAETGEPLGPSGDATPKWFYYGPGIEFGGDRFVYWHWNFSQWDTSVYDISGDTPVRVGLSDLAHGDPTYIPRPGTGQAYLFASDCEYPFGCSPALWLIGRDGTFTRRAGTVFTSARELRRGFLAGSSSYEDGTLAVVRDPELNRAPVADAGAPQTLECEAGGARAMLDGRGSYDPDSTPGTDDDIASVRWTVDGGFAGDALASETWLGKGSHRAVLELIDRLEAEAAAETTVDVVDTRPPEVSLALNPAVDQDGSSGQASWIGDGWWVRGEAEDLCDGPLAARTGIALPEAARAAPYEVTGNPGPPVITLVQTADGPVVFLDGDDAWIEVAWLEARHTGRLPVVAEQSVRLTLAARGPADPRGEVSLRYRLDAEGRVMGALAVGAGADHILDATAADAEGLTGRATRSLRARVEQLCAELPQGTRCAPGLLP